MKNDTYDSYLLKNIFVAQVATLAKAIKAEKKAQGISTTSPCYREAVIEIIQKRDHILALLDEIEEHY
ncbi:hypothetical protein IO45_11495 [Gallibacterium anatis]|uniref:hypothetical protein n=1 Tax=Gallibacterium anatis TaxID=750 RepID=UPI0005316729|nr:hypothetical protein [Gallibacterium anatis]KGQ39893.1 hypothetical protein JP30_09280 [Gallibacterium anatis IPDH697-78]KGQ56921.1 hypothetical protein IO45_11495 [Gallibacterium anatis]